MVSAIEKGPSYNVSSPSLLLSTFFPLQTIICKLTNDIYNTVTPPSTPSQTAIALFGLYESVKQKGKKGADALAVKETLYLLSVTFFSVIVDVAWLIMYSSSAYGLGKA
jgi:hypothetical protein